MTGKKKPEPLVMPAKEFDKIMSAVLGVPKKGTTAKPKRTGEKSKGK